jgi:hypothetical protein
VFMVSLRTGSFDPRDGPRTAVPSRCGSETAGRRGTRS